MPPPPSAFADALILTGPTGSGKTAVALAVAERLGCEIVAMDSMTLYRGMDIGTAKPTAAERERVPHHLLDVLDPWEAGNVAWWLDRAAEACAAIRSRAKRPLFVGGTPFYLKALLHGLFDGPPSEPEIRRKWEAEAERIGKGALHARLAEVDPKTAARLHPNDVRRVVRALEVWELTGRPISSFQQTWTTTTFENPITSPPPIPCVCLEWPRDELYRRIDSRIRAMMDAGWLDEVRRLHAAPRPLSKEAAQALGYRELLEFLKKNESTLEATVTLIQIHTRQFAKRQLTWFRHLSECRTVPADAPDLVGRVATTFGERDGAL